MLKVTHADIKLGSELWDHSSAKPTMNAESGITVIFQDNAHVFVSESFLLRALKELQDKRLALEHDCEGLDSKYIEAMRNVASRADSQIPNEVLVSMALGKAWSFKSNGPSNEYSNTRRMMLAYLQTHEIRK